MSGVQKPATMIDPDDAVMLLVDHQSGLFQLVRDIDLPVLRSHVIALAKVSASPGSRLSPRHRSPTGRTGR
jgi:hypothetical protein